MPAGRLQHLRITSLRLAENKIESIHADAFANVTQVLDLYMPLLSSTLRIVFFNNSLTRIEAFTFANFSQLNDINLGFNRIEWIHPTAFANSPRLHYILVWQ